MGIYPLRKLVDENQPPSREGGARAHWPPEEGLLVVLETLALSLRELL